MYYLLISGVTQEYTCTNKWFRFILMCYDDMLLASVHVYHKMCATSLIQHKQRLFFFLLHHVVFNDEYAHLPIPPRRTRCDAVWSLGNPAVKARHLLDLAFAIPPHYYRPAGSLWSMWLECGLAVPALGTDSGHGCGGCGLVAGLQVLAFASGFWKRTRAALHAVPVEHSWPIHPWVCEQIVLSVANTKRERSGEWETGIECVGVLARQMEI